MAQLAGYSRWCYNWGLSLWNAAYKAGEKPNIRIIREVFINHTKPLYPWMKNLSSKVYQYAFINLGEAFTHVFQRSFENTQSLKRKVGLILSQLIILENQ